MTREERKLRKHMEEAARRPLRRSAKGRQEEPERGPRERLDLRSLDSADPDEVDAAVFGKRQTKEREAAAGEALVVETTTGAATIWWNGRAERRRGQAGLAVGDRVLVSALGRIVQALPRTTTLSRPDPHNPRVERVIAANIDIVVIVASVEAPPLRPGLIDRYLVAIERGGAQPLLCINKIDLRNAPALPAELDPYREIGVPIVPCSAATGQGLDELRAALAGKLCVFVGHSGVGKSSLLNALQPDLGLATGAVSEATEKGRHTTSASSLHHLAGGARVIDTPGIRQFGLYEMRREELRGYFHEFDRWVAGCPFSDCSHTHERDCAVKAAVERGALSAARYETYRRVLDTLVE